MGVAAAQCDVALGLLIRSLNRCSSLVRMCSFTSEGCRGEVHRLLEKSLWVKSGVERTGYSNGGFPKNPRKRMIRMMFAKNKLS
jgi:hypothetical protein